MSTFDAGSIEAKATLDRTPFIEALRALQYEGDRFEARELRQTVRVDVERRGDDIGGLDRLNDHVRVKIDLDAGTLDRDLTELQAKIDALGAGKTKANVGVDIDTSRALIDLGILEATIDRIDGRNIRVTVDVDRSALDRIENTLGALERRIQSLGGSLGGAGGGGNPAGGAGGLAGSFSGMAMAGVAAAALLGPALIPVLGTIGGLAIGGVGAFTVLGAGIGSFAAVAMPAFSKMTAATEELKAAQDDLTNAVTDKEREAAIIRLANAQAAMNGPLGEAAKHYEAMTSAWGELQKRAEGPVFTVLSKVFDIAARVLPMLEPLIVASATAIGQFLDKVDDSLDGGGLEKFIDFLAGQMGPVMSDVFEIVKNLGGGFASMVENSGPLIRAFLDTVQSLTEKFANWTGGGGFQKFVDWVIENLPEVKELFGDVWQLVKDLIKALNDNGNGETALDTVISLVEALDRFVKSDTFDSIIDALRTIADLIGFVADHADGINGVLGALSGASLMNSDLLSGGGGKDGKGKGGGGMAGDLWDAATEGDWTDLLQDKIPLLNTTVGEAAAKIRGWRQDIKDWAADGVDSLKRGVSAGVLAAQGWSNKIMDGAGDLGSAAKLWVERATTNAVSGLGNLVSSGIRVTSQWAGRIITSAGDLGSRLFTWATGGIARLLSGLDISTIITNVGGWGNRILGAMGDLGSLLLDAGRAIIRGLLSGITEGFGGVMSFVSGIAGWISDHKGPIDYDRTLLEPHGRAVMAGLRSGLGDGFRDVENDVRGMAGKLSSIAPVIAAAKFPSVKLDVAASDPEARKQSEILERVAELLGVIADKDPTLNVDGRELVDAIDSTRKMMGRAS